jgi:hypothetical protein
MRRRAARWMGARRGAATPNLDPDDSPVNANEPAQSSWPTPAFPTLGEMTFDDHEALAVSLSRFVFAGYGSGHVAAWDQGFEAALSVLGERRGLAFFTGVLALGRAVKAERVGTFHFLPIGCCRICEDEIELLAALQAARRRDGGLLTSALFILSRQRQAQRIHAAICHLAELVDAMAASGADERWTDAQERPGRTKLH